MVDKKLPDERISSLDFKAMQCHDFKLEDYRDLRIALRELQERRHSGQLPRTELPNTMEVAGQLALINYVPELGAFRGKFLGLSGYCDFVADSIQGLKVEGEISLREYLDNCNDAGSDV